MVSRGGAARRFALQPAQRHQRQHEGHDAGTGHHRQQPRRRIRVEQLAGHAGKLLDPYSPARLLAVMAGACIVQVVVALVALRGLEGEARAAPPRDTMPPFLQALKQVWAEHDARRFTVFIFVSMLATQDLILDPFAGTVFGYTPGQSTALSCSTAGCWPA